MHKDDMQHNGESHVDHPLDSLSKVNPPAASLSTMLQSPQLPEGVGAADGSKIGDPGDGIQLLSALWPSPDLAHQIAALIRLTGKFRNIPVSGVADAVRQALALSGAGVDAYFAVAEYQTPNSREAANVSGARAFWIDLDCGEKKCADGKGYATIDDACVAVERFCIDAGLPKPTHIVNSGGGLHVYWALDRVVACAMWQAYAAKLKRLTHAHGLLADDSRTADISSVLRIPGTLNYKYHPPRPVSLQYASATFIQRASMLDAIDSAHSRLRNVAATQLPRHPANADVSATIDKKLVRLHALVDHIDPNIEYEHWLRVLMALHYETGGSDAGLALADAWSGKGSKYCGSHEIREKWNSFKSDLEKPVTIASLIRMVKINGGDWMAICSAAEEPFEIINDETEGGA